eukprot:gene10296-11395_t
MSKPSTKIEESRFYFGPPPSQTVPTAPVYTTPPDAWVLGEGYHLNDEGKVRLSQHAQSFLRWSYRRDFPALLPYSITSDSGWGCMIRAAQMMISTALLRHYLGKNWRLPSEAEQLDQNEHYCQIVRWFQDRPGVQHIYSLHHMVQCGMKYDKLPGEWWGPSTACHVLRDLVALHRQRYQGQLAVHVTSSEIVYISEVEKLCADWPLNDCLLGLTQSSRVSKGKNIQHVQTRLAQFGHPLPSSPSSSAIPALTSTIGGEAEGVEDEEAEMEAFFDPLHRPPPAATAPWTCSLLLLLPLRLGVNNVSRDHIKSLQEALRNEFCVGILGGRVGHAIYFTGYDDQQDVFYGLDPHTTYPAVATPQEEATWRKEEGRAQIHVPHFVTLSPSQLDPSLALAFYFPTREAFDTFCRHYHQAHLANEGSWTQLVTIHHSPPSYLRGAGVGTEDDDDVVMCYDDEEGNVPLWMKTFLDEAEAAAAGGVSSSSIATKKSSYHLSAYETDDEDDYVIITK